MLNWMYLVWLTLICTAVLLGCFHALLWRHQREQIEHALIAAISFLVAVCGVFEMRAFLAQSPAEYAAALRGAHGVAQLLALAVIVYVDRIEPGRRWLALLAAALRLPVIVANHATGVSLTFLNIDELRTVVLPGGGSFVAPLGTPNPWFALATLGNLVLLAFLVDRLVAVARQPQSDDRRRATQTIGALILIALLGTVTTVALALFSAPVPITISVAMVAFALVVTEHRASDLLHASELARRIRITRSNLDEVTSNLRLVEDSARLGLWQWDGEGRNIRLSERGALLFGRESAGDVEFDELLSALDPDDRSRARISAASFATGAEGEFSGQFRVQTASGTRRWVAVHGRLVRNPANVLVGAHGVIFDVTDHRSNDVVFGIVFESSPSAMLLVDERGCIALANEAAAELSGYPAADLVGMSIDALVPPESQENHDLQRRHYGATAARRQMLPRREVKLLRRDGQRAAVEVTLNPVNINGEILVIATVLDITRRQQEERERSMQRAALAHVARVGMLAELSGSLAHEINQPLAAILSNAQASMRFLGRAEPELGEVREGLAEIVDNAKRAGEVIRRLRAMLRNEPPEFTPLPINETIREVVRLLHSDLIERGVVVNESFADALPPVRGDRVQLQQVLLNLIVNAADAMAGLAAPRCVSLSTGVEGASVLIEVNDHGPGIAETEREQIFQAFVSSKPNGLGFGLALSKTLVESHGGRISVSNNVEGGACFRVLLPAAS